MPGRIQVIPCQFAGLGVFVPLIAIVDGGRVTRLVRVQGSLPRGPIRVGRAEPLVTGTFPQTRIFVIAQGSRGVRCPGRAASTMDRRARLCVVLLLARPVGVASRAVGLCVGCGMGARGRGGRGVFRCDNDGWSLGGGVDGGGSVRATATCAVSNAGAPGDGRIAIFPDGIRGRGNRNGTAPIVTD